MKKTIKLTVTLAIGLISMLSIAQRHDSVSKHQYLSPEVILEKLDAKLSLNETQEKRVLTLLENRLAQRQDFKSKRSASFKEERAKMHLKIKSILDEDQIVKFEKLKAKHNKDFKNKECKPKSCGETTDPHSRMRPEQRLEKLTIDLDLNKDQQAHIKRIFKEKRAEFKKNHPEVIENRKQIKAGFERDMKTILSPEQFKTFMVLKEEYKMNKKRLHKH